MKKQLKKSFSLFLAVIMLMSCWVWVAPQKAEAGAPNNYTVEISFDVSDACNGGEVRADVTHISNNGTGSATTTSWALDKCESDEGQYTLSKDFAGWPSQIYILVDQGGVRTQNIKVTSITINGQTVLSGEWTLNPGHWGSADRTYKPNSCDNPNADGMSGTVSGTAEGTWNWPRPKLNTATATIPEAQQTLALAKVNTGTNSTSSISIGGFVDTYGVNWTGTITPSFTLRGEGDVALGSNATITSSGNSRTITVKPWFQTLYPGKQSAKLYVDWSVNNKAKSGTETITITFPTYTATFYANGVVGADGVMDAEIGEDAYSVDKDGVIELTHDKMNIGSVIGSQPAYANRPGFEFMGYYSKDNADALGKDTSFVGTKFENKVTKVPHTANAASGYDPDASYFNSNNFFGDTKWFAAWQAAPLEITFVTADNQLIATLTGRHNNKMTADDMYGPSGLNAAVRAAYTGSTIKFDSDNAPIYKDGATTYDFAGWKIISADDASVVDKDEDTILTTKATFQATYTLKSAETYTVSFKDLDGTVISEKSGYKYREDVTNVPASVTAKEQDDVYSYEFIGWAKDIGKNFYTVDEYNKDVDGALINYTHKDSAEFTVKGNATYVPVYRMTKREYSVTYTYKLDGNVDESITIDGFNWHDNPTMPEIKDNYTYAGRRNFLVGWKINNAGSNKQLDEILVEGNMNITASYGNAVPAEYTINFYGKDIDAVTDIHLNPDNNIYQHNATVTAPEVPEKIDTADALYTFKAWNPRVTAVANGDRDYYAEYTKKDYADVYFYNYDGSLIYKVDGKESQLFVGDRIPAYSNVVDGVDVFPEKPEDEIGTYTFTGWADSNGTVVKPGTSAKLSGDLHITAQFKTVYKEYDVKFLDDDGTEILIKKYHYGEEIEIPADPTKAEDVEYSYAFRAWTPDVSEICHGDATYTAAYRRTPKYYQVTWFRDNKTLLAESNYTYNAKIQPAVINAPAAYAPAETGKTWAFDHWVQCDKDGNALLVNGEEVVFVRGQRMGTEHLYFYPVFVQVENVLKVTFYKEDGTSYLGEAHIPYGAALEDYADAFAAKAPKLSDDEYHYIIKEWVNTKNGEVVTEITADVSVKATYTAEAHSKQIYELIAAPTCNVPGYAHFKCDVPECTDIEYNQAIAPIPDESKPTGQIYVGDTKWTFDDYDNGIDYDAVKYVGPKTSLVVNAEDTGSRSMPWNLEGKLFRGVGKIEYNVSIAAITNPATIDNWTEIYNYEEARQEALNAILKKNNLTLLDYTGFNFGTAEQKMQKAAIDREVDAALANSKANATGIVSNLDLTNGRTYVIYIKVSDREGVGEANVAYFSSGTISYGDDAPEISITGEGYGAKFCKDAVISVTDDTEGVKGYLNGKEVALEEDGTFYCDEIGLHNFEAIDIHGNKTARTFEIKGSHTYRNYTIAASCETAGSRYDLCTDCGAKANEETIPALGHSYTANSVDKAPDCVTDGYRTYTCDNNCGTKLVLKPTDSADTLAQAKKYVEAETEGEEGTWVSLTADDLKHLKATGKHTYAMVKDENGNDTAEFVWVVDKAANCSVEGSKHRDCIVCGIAAARVTEVIAKDLENGHNFYRVKVTTAPTCTTVGAKTKTCKYCAIVEFVEEVPALGHTAGEYRVITPATCEAAGSKILTCSVCNVDIGEPVKDADGKVTGFDGKAVEIKATGHAWVLDGEIYQNTEDGKYYQNYICENDNTHKKQEVVEGYVPPVAAVVTFMNGDETVATIDKYVGETIIETAVTAPTKAADATKVYNFAYWATKNADGTYTEAKFPIEVKGDATYYAVFAEKYINYTITYYKEDGTTEFKKTGYLHNGEEVTLAGGPAKAETNLVKYEFAGWQLTTGDTVYTDKVTIDGANINLKATYKEIKKQYAVTYAYSSSNQIHTYLVDAGTAAPDATKDFDIEKAYDAKYHYTFKEWNRAAQLASVESNIYTTPNFEAVLHEYKLTKTEAPSCGVNEINTWTCEVCGHSYQEEKTGTALEHDWSDPVYDEETGKNTVTCQREGCGVTQTDTRSFTVKFYFSETADSPIKTVSYIPWGTTIGTVKLPADPMKEETSEYTYKFMGWALKGTTTVVDVANAVVKADAEYVAIFQETIREYSVTFAYDAYNVIKVVTGVKAGATVTYDGQTPTKNFDDNYHYTFSGWSGSTENILKDTYVTAVFSREEHKGTPTITEATCTTGAGTVYTCDKCDYESPVVSTSKPLGHDYKEVAGTRVEPKDCKDGYVTMRCSRCGDEYKKTLPWTGSETPDTPATPDKVVIKITVRDQHGNGIPGATVALYQNSNWVAQDITNSSGVVAFEVAPGKYTAVFTGVKYSGDQQTEITVDNKGNVSGNIPQMYINNCGCACHRDNIWGKIFRFFHSIIKMITGEFKCCKDPSDLY